MAVVDEWTPNTRGGDEAAEVHRRSHGTSGGYNRCQSSDQGCKQCHARHATGSNFDKSQFFLAAAESATPGWRASRRKEDA